MWLQVQASRRAVERELAVLSEGGFFDSLTQDVGATLLTYNAVLRVFGIVQVLVHQTDVGIFEMRIAVSAVNAAWPVNTRTGLQMLALPVAASLLATMSVWEALCAVWQHRSGIARQVRRCLFLLQVLSIVLRAHVC